MTVAAKKKPNFTEGPFLKKIIVFAIPLILTGVLQSLYNAADLVVVGQFSANKEIALAAIGNTGALTNLVVGLFMGLSVGAGVCVAQHIGANERREVQKVLHTAIVVSGFLGVVIGIFGFLAAPYLLRWMDTPPSVIDSSVLYIRIIFCGMPASMIYNYTASMLRSYGDSKHPLIFLTVAGVTNVVLNLILVAMFHLDVAGVAVATVVAQYLSAVLMLIFLSRQCNCMKFSLPRLRLHKDKLVRMLYIGIPSGLQGILFSLSNVLIQSSINSFQDETIMAGNATAGNLEGFVYIAMNAIYHVAITFVGQNVGAKKYGNIRRIMLYCTAVVVVLGVGTGAVVLLFREFFVGLYQDSPEVIARAVDRLWIILTTYWMCGIMEVFCGGLRAMGKSVTAMVVSLAGACGFRILWLQTVFVWFRSPACIYFSYPVSWFLTAMTHIIIFSIILHKTRKRYEDELFSAELAKLDAEKTASV
ncbi:MAG: MATE family efflux transporter [Clostridia bacterium]|nr:MATE family efflux transporter [Clostridia bacterium]